MTHDNSWSKNWHCALIRNKLEYKKIIADGKADPKLIVSHDIKMTDWQNAFDTLMSGKACKIVIDPQN